MNECRGVDALMTRSAQLELWSYFRVLCDLLLDPNTPHKDEVQAEMRRVRVFIFDGPREVSHETETAPCPTSTSDRRPAPPAATCS